MAQFHHALESKPTTSHGAQELSDKWEEGLIHAAIPGNIPFSPHFGYSLLPFLGIHNHV